MPRKKRSRDKVTGKKVKKAKEKNEEVDELYQRINPPKRAYYEPNKWTRSKKSRQKARKRKKLAIARMKKSVGNAAKAPRVLQKNMRASSDGAFPSSFRRDELHPRYNLFKVWSIDDPREPFENFCDSLRRKGISPNVKRLFHGTPGRSLVGICRDSLKVGRCWGLLGQGIYFTSYLAKAFSFSDWEHKFIIRADVALGRILIRRGSLHSAGWEEMQRQGYESSYTSKVTGLVSLNFDEYCVYHPNQVQIVSVAEYHVVE